MLRYGFRVCALLGVLAAWTVAVGTPPRIMATETSEETSARFTQVARSLPEVVAMLDQGTAPAGDALTTPDTAVVVVEAGGAPPIDQEATAADWIDLSLVNADNLLGSQELCCAERHERVWFRSDYLLWWTKGSQLPPLVTTSPGGTDREDAGVLGQPETTILFGDGYVNNDSRSGYRLTGGFWLDACETIGIAFDFFELEPRQTGFSVAGNGDPILARPFYNVETGLQDAELVSFPNVISGSVSVSSRDFFQSTGAWLNLNLCGTDWCGMDCCCRPAPQGGYRINLLAGYRYYRYTDSLSIHEDLTVTEPEPQALTGTRIDVQDHFRTENEFNGGEIGFRTEVYRGRWSLGLLTKMAIGNNRQVVSIQGQTTTAIPSLLPVTNPGGLLTSQTNIGRYTDDQFTVIPQLGAELGFQVCDHLRIHAGYDLVYWPHVQTAGGQIDMAVDPRNIPPAQPGGTMFPAPQFASTDFWAQGLNCGVELRY